MTISDLCSLLGGLGLFLYGMWMLRSHLEAAAGKRLQEILKKLTAKPFYGFLAGTGITAAMQSSTAVTVLLVGFVDAGLCTLEQAVWVILGANIGTTVTGQLTAMDAKAAAPVLAFAGILLLLFSKRDKVIGLGGALAGSGVMLMGLSMMETAMLPLGESERFRALLTGCRNPVTAILMGTVFTAALQSSSASVGILQTLARNGLVDLEQGMYLVFGQNMGTCVTALLASAGACCNAKRTAVLHLMINVLGTVLFLILCQGMPMVFAGLSASALIEGLTPMQPARQIANVHTIFNIVTSLALLPFGGLLVKLAEKLVPEI